MAFRAPEKAHLYNEFAKLLQAGFGIDRAADTILDQEGTGAARTFAEGVRNGVAGGKSIAEAVAAVPLPVSDLEIGIIAAGEKGGRLEDSFAHLATYYDMLARTASRIRSRLIYPALLLHLAVILPALPRAILGRAGGDGPGFLASVAIQLLMLYAAVGLIGLGWHLLNRAARTNSSVDALLNRIPLVGAVRRSLALSRFARVFEIYLLSGQRVSDGVRAAGLASRSGSVSATALAAERAALSGDAVGPVFLAAPSAVPRAMARSIATAEEAGTLEKELHRWALLQEANAGEALERFGEWMPKIIYLLAVLFVAWQIIDLFMNFYVNPYGEMLEDLDSL